jgi:acyl-homoserine lactone acylase PvdQ
MKRLSLIILVTTFFMGSAVFAQSKQMSDEQIDRKVESYVEGVNGACNLNDAQQEQLTVLYKNMLIESMDIKGKYSDDEAKMKEAKKEVRANFKEELEKLLNAEQMEAYKEYNKEQREMRKQKKEEREKKG